MDGIRLLRYGTLVPVIYATPSLWTILMLNSQLPHESYRVYFANIVILYNDLVTEKRFEMVLNTLL